MGIVSGECFLRLISGLLTDVVLAAEGRKPELIRAVCMQVIRASIFPAWLVSPLRGFVYVVGTFCY
jgi:hypothetical protein